MVLMEVVGPDPLSLPERRKLVVKARSAVDETEKSDFLDAVVVRNYYLRGPEKLFYCHKLPHISSNTTS